MVWCLLSVRVWFGSERGISVCALECVLGVPSTDRWAPCTNQLGPCFEHWRLLVVPGEVGLLVWFSTDPFSTENKLLNLTVLDPLWICDVHWRTILHPWCRLPNGAYSIRKPVLFDQAPGCWACLPVFSSPASIASLYHDSTIDNILLNGRLMKGKLMCYSARNKSIKPSLSWSIVMQCLTHDRTEWWNFCWNWLIYESSREVILLPCKLLYLKLLIQIWPF